MIYRSVPFSMTLNDLYPRFQGHAVYLTLNILEMVRHTDSFNENTNNRVSTTPGNPENLLEFKWSSWKFLCNDRKFYFMVNGFTT